MLKLRIVTTSEDEVARAISNVTEDRYQSLPHGTKVLPERVHPWAGSNRIVCADSYFVSETTAIELIQLERKILTANWSLRVNMSILSICVVDSWLG